MPLFKLKKVWDYCSFNIPFFIFIVLLIFTISWISDFSLSIYGTGYEFMWVWILQAIITIVLTGYGMSIVRDRINHGYRLPKIMPKQVISLGIKGYIVYVVYISFQLFILNYIAKIFDFPVFDLHDLLLNFHDTFHLLLSHNPDHAIIFFTLSGIVFYITTFFVDTGLAQLADTNSLLKAFNLVEIFRSINIFGWKNYARDITSITLAIVILGYLQSIDFPDMFLSTLWATFFGFLMFSTQYLGIGAVYCNMKDKRILYEKIKEDQLRRRY